MSEITSTETKITLAKMANINTARELGFSAMFSGLTLVNVQSDKIGMARANLVIVAHESGKWAELVNDAAKPAFADWAAFCKHGLGITRETPISGSARKHLVRALRDRTDNLRAEIKDIAAGAGATDRTIARDIAELGIADAEKSAAGTEAQRLAGNLGDGSNLTATGDLPKLITSDKGVKSVDLAAVVTYLTTQVDPAELAGLFGREFVAKLAGALPAEDSE